MSEPVQPTDLASTKAPPLNISGYAILDKLAVGGMASIHIAQRKHSEEVCIIKILHDTYAQDKVVTSRFKREARVAAMLDHPNIAKLLDAKQDGELFFLAMEFIAGKDMESLMFKLAEEHRMLPPALSVGVGLKVLEGLHYAHTLKDPEGEHLGIVHRDLSPRNVMLTYTGEVKIIDFGLARARLDSFRTQPGMLLGTLRYMSPEQATADHTDHRSDIYTWGSVLYEALSGTWLARGNSPQEILKAVVTETPPPLSHYNPHLPKGLDTVIAKAISKDAEDRFETAKEFRDAFRLAAGELADVPQELIGEFLTNQYREDAAKVEIMISNAKRGEYTDEFTAIRDSPAFEATRAGVPEFTQVRPSSSKPPPRSNTPVLLGHPEASGEQLPEEHFQPTNVINAEGRALIDGLALSSGSMHPRSSSRAGSISGRSASYPSSMVRAVSHVGPPPKENRTNQLLVILVVILVAMISFMIGQRSHEAKKTTPNTSAAPGVPPRVPVEAPPTPIQIKPQKPPPPTKGTDKPLTKKGPPKRSSAKRRPSTPPVSRTPKRSLGDTLEPYKDLKETYAEMRYANGWSEDDLAKLTEKLNRTQRLYKVPHGNCMKNKIELGTGSLTDTRPLKICMSSYLSDLRRVLTAKGLLQ